MAMTPAIDPDDQLPPWAYAVGILSVLWLLGLFFTVRANSADYWAEDGVYNPAVQAARR